MKHLISITLVFGLTFLSFSQENAPKIAGKVKISIKDGTFECDLTISNIPNIEDYFIRLNSGMNVLHFKSKKPDEFAIVWEKSFKDSMSSGESSAYYFPDNTDKGKFLPEVIQCRYVGKFPIANDTIVNYSREDWKGNIAFNGYSVRTDGLQTAWYPYLYDAKKDISYEKMYYDIEIECLDCSTIYVNGNIPASTQKISLKSEQPYELALFCGQYDFTNDGNLIMLNSTSSKQNLADFSKLISQFKGYYEKKLNIKFNEPPVFVYTTPTSIDNSWLYVCYPTIIGIGRDNIGLAAFFNEKTQDWYRQFIAHELGHYYFGTYKVPNSVLGNMISEGFSEYLSLKLVEEIQGKDFYYKKLKEKFDYLKDFKTLPISKIKSKSQIEDQQTFAYDYAPMLFIAIEKEIGEEKMWEWINTILMTKSDFTNYDFLVSTLKITLKDDVKTQLIIEKYFSSDMSTENIITKLNNVLKK